MNTLAASGNPVDHLRLHTILRIDAAGLRLDITEAVLFMWAGCAVLVGVFLVASRHSGPATRGLRTVLEAMLLFIREDIVKRNMGSRGVRYFPLIATLFFFILVSNWVGLVPLPFSYSATSNISVTAALAMFVFVLVQVEGLRLRGVRGYLRGFVPEGVPTMLLPLMVPIEIISALARPFSLAIRLFANMLAGHLLILVFLGMSATGLWFLKAVPLVGAVLMSLFEIFVGLVQAYIFSMLTAIYLSEVVGEA
ncbi:MAG: F0F1 ATP synthase subunit A [Candidatus Eisenbacteria bacterium]|jgi:F-type H+-transporting ATPase subunit a|nr:F0F1 ATP synthase subunit A [Candidatus Eisenbacteria bacterium]